MWRKVANWYRALEDEQLAVLEEPSLAAHAPAGYRRYTAKALAEMSPHERQQLRDFSLAYRGWRRFLIVGKLFLAFTLGGVLLHLAIPEKFSWLGALAVANLVGFFFVFDVARAWFNYRKIADRKLRLVVRLGLYAVLGAFVGLGVAVVIKGKPLAGTLEKLPGLLTEVTLGVGLLVVAPLMIISVVRKSQYEKLTAQLQREAERDRLARELSESQLRLLRAQIEPHFLFNTLGAVQQLAEHGAPRAAELTASLIAFLRASSSEMRSAQTPLHAEFGLVESYLQVMQARLGERLRFTLTLPQPLAQVQVPTMILLTLAENAIKHGIEPSLAGGEVHLSAQASDGTIRLRVHDSGVGMSVTPGAGLGLENVRRRLQLAYPGSAASLTLHEAEPGLIADILIPSERAK